MRDRQIEIEAIEARIAKLRHRLFELREQEPVDMRIEPHCREYRTAAEFGWQRDNEGVAIVGSCQSEDGRTGSYRYMVDRHVLASLRNSDVFSYWEHVLKRTIKHLAREMYDPEQGIREKDTRNARLRAMLSNDNDD